MINISTNNKKRTTTSDLSSLNIKKETKKYDVGSPGLGQAQ